MLGPQILMNWSFYTTTSSKNSEKSISRNMTISLSKLLKTLQIQDRRYLHWILPCLTIMIHQRKNTDMLSFYPVQRCTECEKLKVLEDKWILKHSMQMNSTLAMKSKPSQDTTEQHINSIPLRLVLPRLG